MFRYYIIVRAVCVVGIALLGLSRPMYADVIEDARKLFRAGKDDEASKMLTTAIDAAQARLKESADDPAIHAELAKLQMELGQLEEALTSIDRAIRIDPKEPEYRLVRGGVRQFLGRSTEAEEDCKAAQTLSGNQSRYMFEYGRFLAFVGRKDDAREQFRNTFKLHGDFQPALFELVKLLAEQKQFDEVIQLLVSAAKKWPNDEVIRYALGQAFRQNGDLERAYQEFAEAVRINPTNLQAESKLLVIANALERKDDAEKHLVNVYRLFEQGHAKLPFFQREEFEVDKRGVSANEYFSLRGSTPAKFEFWVDANESDRLRDVYRLGTDETTNEVARSLGLVGDGEPMYFLYGMVGPMANMEHFMYFPKEMPDYATIRSMVVEIVEGKRMPIPRLQFKIEVPADVKADKK